MLPQQRNFAPAENHLGGVSRDDGGKDTPQMNLWCSHESDCLQEAINEATSLPVDGTKSVTISTLANTLPPATALLVSSFNPTTTNADSEHVNVKKPASEQESQRLNIGADPRFQIPHDEIPQVTRFVDAIGKAVQRS